jgi:hypothetical protein
VLVGYLWILLRKVVGGAYEEHGEVAGSDDGGAGDDGVAGYGEEHEDADVNAAVAGCAGGPGYGDGDEEGGEPDWRVG